MSSKSFIFSIKSLAALHLYLVSFGPTVFDAAMGIRTGVKVIAKVMRSRLIDLLVAIAAPTFLGMWWAGVLA